MTDLRSRVVTLLVGVGGIAALVVVLALGGGGADLLAAATAGPSAAPTPSSADTGAPSDAGPSPSPSPSPSDALSFPPGPTPTPVACPSDPPTSGPIGGLADPACYAGSTLTLTGWLQDTAVALPGAAVPGWYNALVRLAAAPPRVREWGFGYMSFEGWGLSGGSGLPVPAVSLVTLPGSAVDLSRLDRWVTVTGHFRGPDDPACASATPYDAADCDRVLIVTKVTAATGAAPVCPTGSPLSLTAFLDAPVACFGGRVVTVQASGVNPGGLGGDAPQWPVAFPGLRSTGAWLVSVAGSFGSTTEAVGPFVLDGSGVSFDEDVPAALVTGHFFDPGASTCTTSDPGGIGWAPPAWWVQRRCAHYWVLSAVTPLATPPPGVSVP